MDQTWLAIYRNFDDDALAALASIGLLRRAAKDVDAGKVMLKEPIGPSVALIEADGQQVRIGQSGPAQARCDCPAPGICKHILAAALWLRHVPSEAALQTPASDALAEVLALDPVAIFKLAGVAATRKAAVLFSDIGTATIAPQGGVLVIELRALELACRYVAGGGFQGMVSEASASTRAAVHLLALAAVWRDQGRVFTWPESAASPALTVVGTLTDTEHQFLQRVQAVVIEVCRIGWSHVSEVIPVQLRAFGMSARIESFPRLARLLRTLAGNAELLAKRDVSGDERRALRMAARIHALCHALQHATGDVLQELRGSARRVFEGNDVLELLPLGAHWWEQRSGARGLTILFWDYASGGVIQTVLARPDANDPGFTRDSAWSYSALWQGAGTAISLCSGGALALEAARLSTDNRVSLSKDTRARSLPPWAAADERWTMAGFDDWRELAASIRDSAGLRGDMAEFLLLKPSSLESPRLDERHQLLCWTVRDVHGLPLQLRLPCEAHHVKRIEHIEAWAASGVSIKAVVARCERDAHGGILEPVSLMIETSGVLRSISLDYVAPARNSGPSFMSRMTRMLRAKDVAAVWTARPSHVEQLNALLRIIENKGMTGRLHRIDEDRAELLAAQQHLRATGLDMAANAVGSYVAAPNAQKALILVHLCHTCAELDTDFIFR